MSVSDLLERGFSRETVFWTIGLDQLPIVELVVLPRKNGSGSDMKGGHPLVMRAVLDLMNV